MPNRMFKVMFLSAGLATLPALATAQSHEGHHPADTAFAKLQERGAAHMGVDQYSSTHRFQDLPDGGRIVLMRDSTDTAGVATIRSHLKHIAVMFAEGNFDIPMLVHAQTVPGTDVMRARREMIRYEMEPVSGGGAVRLISTDAEAVAAIHRFLAFQRMDHRAGS